MKIVGPKKQEWQSIPGCGDVGPWVFFGCCDPQSSPKPSTSRKAGQALRTPILYARCSMYGFFTKAKKWQNRKMSCFKESYSVPSSTIYFLLEDSILIVMTTTIWIAQPPSLVVFWLRNLISKRPFFEVFLKRPPLDFPIRKTPLWLSLKMGKGWVSKA